MKKAFNYVVAALLGSVNLNAQFNCLSHEVHEQEMQTNPEYRKNQTALELETLNSLQNKSQSSAAPTYIIPVVFHVIYTTPYGNISDAQIIDQINILNKEFKRQQSDTLLTPAAFLPLAAPFDVEFRLATLDPNGNCTNGINRVYSTLSNCSVNNNEIKTLSYWPSNQYLNIWLPQTMHYNSSTNCGGGGYATFPGGVPAYDGINIRGDLIGSIGTSASNPIWGNFLGRYLIHELGHWFNLRHIWGDALCGNDFVSDTPTAENANSGCPNFPHNPLSQCPGSTANGEMFTDYMDYTDGYCLNMFTAGQVARMTAAINSATSGRNNLWTAQNLQATGTSDPYSYPSQCGAIPNVSPYDPITICVGDSVKLTDESYGGLTSSRLWNAPGGTVSSTTDSIIYVRYNTPGLYNIALTINYLNTSKTNTFTNKILVLNNVANASYSYPFQEDCEDSFQFTNDWKFRNPDNDATAWELTNSTSVSGNNCATIKNFGKSAPMIDELISPEYDLSAVFNPTLTFKLSFAARTANDNDKLQVFVSKNCGKSWTSVYQKTANSGLNTIANNVTTSYTPAIASADWRLEKSNLLNFWTDGIVNFKFVFTSGGGNNIFIDDINIEGINTTGLNELSNTNHILLYPNPSHATLNLEYVLSQTGDAKIEITDLLGKVQFQEITIVQSYEKVQKHIDIRSLSNGSYIITVKQNGAIVLNSKFIKIDY